MANQNTTSSTTSPQDSFLDKSKARQSVPLRPPRSQASQSPTKQPKPTTLTAEALAMLSSKNKDQTAACNYNRIKDFLNALPDPGTSPEHDETPDEVHHPDQTTVAKKTQNQSHYYTPPFHPQHLHIFNRFQQMRREDPWAEFHTHNAWLSLEYSENGNVCMYVGVQTTEHCNRIDKHMTWLKDKWLGVGVGIAYHVMEYEDDEKVDKSRVDEKRDQEKVGQGENRRRALRRLGIKTKGMLDASTWSDFGVFWPV